MLTTATDSKKRIFCAGKNPERQNCLDIPVYGYIAIKVTT